MQMKPAATRLAAAALTALMALTASAAWSQTTVKLWLHEHPPRLAVDKAIIAEFEKANPDIKVQYDVIPPAEFGQKLLTAFASGSGPDLFANASLVIAQYQAARILAPVDYAALGFADEKALTSLYFAGFDGVRFGGRLHGVPVEVSNWVCYANNAIWKEAGLDPAKDFPKTWEALPAVAEKLTQRDANGVPRRRGFDFNWMIRNQLWYTTSTMFHQLGQRLVDDQSGKVMLDSPAGRRVMQYLADHANKHKLGGPQYTDPRAEFLGGRLATECTFGLFGIPQMKNAKVDFSVHPAPRWADATSDNGLDAYAFYMMVNARSPAPTQKAAWKLARMYIDRAVELFETAGLFVPRQEVMNSPGYRSDPNIAIIVEELRKSRFSPAIPGHDQVLDVFLKGRDQVVQGGQPVDKVVPVISEEMNTVLARARARAGGAVQ